MPSAGARTAWPTAEEMSTALCVPVLAGERIGAAAEAVGEDAAHRGDRRRGGEQLRLRHELLFEHREVASRRCERKLILSTSSRYGLPESSVGRSAADAALARLVERRDAGDDGQLAGAVFHRVELAAERFDRLAELLVGALELPVFALEFDSSCVWESEVKYWTEKNVERQSEEVTSETIEKSRRCDTFNFRNLARACGTKMIVE